jgi:hypothetical protein
MTSTESVLDRPGRTGHTAVTALAVGATVVLVTLGTIIGGLAFSEVSDEGGEILVLDGTSGEVLVQILARNLSAALLLFSGYATLGVTTVIGLSLISIYVGSSGQAILTSTGVDGLNPAVWAYVSMEFGGLLVVGVAGLVPLAATLLRWLGDRPVPRGYATRRSLRLLVLGVTLIVAGAMTETLVIVTSR